MIKKIFLHFPILWLISGTTLAAEQDFQAWGGAIVSRQFAKKTELSAGYEMRYINNAQYFGSSYISVGADYKLNKHITAGLDVRYGTSRVWDRFRYGAGCSYKNNISKLQYSLRLRYEYEFYKQAIPEIGQFPAKNNFRFRLEVQYKVQKKLKLFLSCEPQYRIIAREYFFQRLRNIGGLDWEYRKKHTISVAWYYQPEFNESGVQDFTTSIVSVSYHWTLPKFKRKKEN